MLLFLIPIALGLLWKSSQEELPLKDACSGCESSSTTLEADILHNMPFFEHTSLLIANKNFYNKPFLLNSQEITSEDETQKALLYGAYWANVTFLYLFDKKEEVPIYLNTLQTLHHELEIAYPLDFEYIKKSKESNLDSLFNNLHINFAQLTCCLANQKRAHMGSLILFGAWLEQMNYLCLLYEKYPSEKLKTLIIFGKVFIEGMNMLSIANAKSHQKSLLFPYITALKGRLNKSTIHFKVQSSHYSRISLEERKQLVFEDEMLYPKISVSDPDFLTIRQEIKRLRKELLVK